MFLFLFFVNNPVYAAGEILINEVYYDVDDAHGKETSPVNEWIELYNKSSSQIDISNWQIQDNSSTKQIPASTPPIPAGGLVLISPDPSTWNYWGIDQSVGKIIMAIGNGLSNTGDRLILKDSSGNQMDKLSYGSDINVWNPALPDIAEGHSLERFPGGIDTDTIADFVDQETPTPSKLISQYILPSQTPSSQKTQETAKSPSPTPLIYQTARSLPSPSPSKSPSQSLSASVNVLGQSTQSATPSSNQTDQALIPSPPTGNEVENTTSKASDLLIAGGLMLTGFSLGAYLWYKGKSKNENKF